MKEKCPPLGQLNITFLVGLPPLWLGSGKKVFRAHKAAISFLVRELTDSPVIIVVRRKDIEALRVVLSMWYFREGRDYCLTWWGREEEIQARILASRGLASDAYHLIVSWPCVRYHPEIPPELGIPPREVRVIRSCGKFAFVLHELRDPNYREVVRSHIIGNLRYVLSCFTGYDVWLLGDYPPPEYLPEGKVRVVHILERFPWFDGPAIRFPQPLL